MDQKDIIFYDIYDVWYEPVWKQRWFLGVLLFLGVMGVCGGLLLWWRYHAKKRKALLPWEQALEELSELKNNLHIEANQWYTHLTHILKKYIVTRYNISVASKTDFEIAEYIKKAPLSPAACQYLEKIFKEAALVRFRYAHHNRALMLQDLQEGMCFIQNSIPPHNGPLDTAGTLGK